MPGLHINPSALDLGEVWEQKDFSCKIPISNTTAHPIEIPGFAISCRCRMKVEPRQLTIPGGETAEVGVHLDLTHRLSTEMGLAERPISIELTPLAKNGQPLRHGWKLDGIVKSRLTLDCNHLDFGESAAVGELPLVRKVRAIAHIPVKRLAIDSDPEIVTVRATPANAANTFELQISPSRGLLPGAFKTSVSVDVITETGERLAGAELPVSGLMQPEIRPLPARLFLPSGPVGGASEGTVVLQGRGDAPLTVKKIESDSPDVTVTPVEPKGTSIGRSFRIVQRITKQGDQASVVRFTITRQGREPTTVPVEVLVYGTQETSN